MSGWNRKGSSQVSEETVWLVALQLRHHYGSARFEVRLGENVVLIRPIAESGPEFIDRVAFYLRSMGWSTFQSEGSIPRIIVTGRDSAISLGL